MKSLLETEIWTSKCQHVFKQSFLCGFKGHNDKQVRSHYVDSHVMLQTGALSAMVLM